MNLEELEGYFRGGARTLLLCSPHNPTGRVWTRQELSALAALCVEYDVTVISDEIHGDIVMPGYTHIPIMTLPGMAERTITLISATKTFNLGGMQRWLDRTKADPYPAAASFIKGYSNVSLVVNDAISWFYDVGVVAFVGFLTSLVSKAHNGSQSRYVLWVLVGSVAVIAIFALS
jgi:hypothetical protein